MMPTLAEVEATPLRGAARASWRLLTERTAETTDERRRSNLEVVARHIESEVRGDIDTLMATMVDEPVYTIRGASTTPGPKGRDEVVENYRALVRSGRNRLEYRVSRVIVDDDAVVTDGEFFHGFDHDALASRGLLNDVDCTTAYYLVAYRALIVWPISQDGRIEGEHMYAAAKRVVRPLEPGDMTHLGPVSRDADSS